MGVLCLVHLIFKGQVVQEDGGDRWMHKSIGEGARDDYFQRKVSKAVGFVDREFATGNWEKYE
jgi:hypothetical protein